MTTDLHIHSYYSSGTQSPEEAIQEAISKGITFISFTDDDSMDAYQEMDDLAKKYDITYIKGAQVSASRFRLLAYDCDPENTSLQALFKENRAIWDDIGLEMLKLMMEERPELSVDDYIKYKHIPKLGGFKFNNYLYHKGIDGGDDTTSKWLVKNRDKLM